MILGRKGYFSVELLFFMSGNLKSCYAKVVRKVHFLTQILRMIMLQEIDLQKR